MCPPTLCQVRLAHTKVAEANAASRAVGLPETAAAGAQPLFYLGWALSIVLCGVSEALSYNFAPLEILAPFAGLTLILNIWVRLPFALFFVGLSLPFHCLCTDLSLPFIDLFTAFR